MRNFAKMNQTKNTMLKYPIGIQSFDQIINGNYVYVDKTAFALPVRGVRDSQ